MGNTLCKRLVEFFNFDVSIEPFELDTGYLLNTDYFLNHAKTCVDCKCEQAFDEFLQLNVLGGKRDSIVFEDEIVFFRPPRENALLDAVPAKVRKCN